MKKTFRSLWCISCALVPQFVFAASPQQMLDIAIQSNLRMSRPTISTLLLKADLRHVPLVKKEDTFSASFETVVEHHLYPRQNGKPDMDVRVLFPRLAVRSQETSGYGLPTELTFPFEVQLNVIGPRLYGRLADLSAQAAATLRGANMTQAISMFDKWVYLDADEATRYASNILPAGAIPTADPSWNETAKTLPKLRSGELKLLQATGLESRKRVHGKEIHRIRVRIHPTVWQYLETTQLENSKKDFKMHHAADLVMDKTFEKEERARLRKELLALQKLVSGLRMIAVVNTTDHELTRLEFKIQHTEPSYAHDMETNRGSIYTPLKKKLVARDVVLLQGSLNVASIPDATIPVPEGAKSLIDFLSPSNGATATSTDMMVDVFATSTESMR